MNWKLPNQLTVARLVLAGGFFVLLAVYDPPPRDRAYLLNVSLAVFVLAGVTDVLDGYLARKMNAVSAFGRISDPFVDKVLVCGAFALLAGSNFTFGPSTGAFERSLPGWLTGGMASGVQAWMVVVVVAREFVVSGVRGYSESQGQKFAASVYGKVKLLAQSAAICAVLFQLANLPRADWAVATRLGLVWLGVAGTVISALGYVSRARGLLKEG
jgi:CDP-diacylglycerol--glycerol-3-phosphate 3-phosphatidyltransferase